MKLVHSITLAYFSKNHLTSNIHLLDKIKLFLTAIIIIFSTSVYGQSPYQIADTAKVWSTILIGHGSWNVCGCATKINKFTYDTIIGGNTFFEVLESEDSLQNTWINNGLLMEDTINKKVYYTWGNTGLIYDFNIEVGDTVYIDNYYTTYTSVLFCDSINTILINEKSKNMYFFSSDYSRSYPAEIWIEGIGSLHGLLNSGIGGVMIGGGHTRLLCYSENDTVFYSDPLFDECYIDQFYPQIIPETYDTAYVDTYYEFQLQISTFDVDSFALKGDVIPEGFSFNESTGLLTGMPTETGAALCVITCINYDLGGWITDMIYADIQVMLPTTINKLSELDDFIIYPVPFNTKYCIEAKNYNGKDYYLEVFNTEGILIDKKILHNYFSEIDCSRYKTGQYMFKISDDKHNILKVEKVIKK